MTRWSSARDRPGVEIAGQIAELARRTLRREFRAVRDHRVRVILVDAGPQVLQPFGTRLGDRAQLALERLGVEVLLHAVVTDVDSFGLEVHLADGRSTYLAARTKIRAAGVSANPLGQILAGQSEASLDRAGRVAVRSDLTLPGHPEVFVIGDMAALRDLPGVATPRLPDRLPQPLHHRAALVHLVRGPWPLGADGHRAAGLRARSPHLAAGRRRRPRPAPTASGRSGRFARGG